MNLLPPGAEKLYDLTPTGDVFRLFDGVAATVKRFGFDLLDTLRDEIFPSAAVEKLPDWETALALTGAAETDRRRTSILSRLREFGAFTPYLVRSIIAPLVGYADFNGLRIIEADRTKLAAFHTYVDEPAGAQGAIPANGTLSRPMYTPDGGRASRAGAQ
ncbi:MAG: hypothetical protein ACREES_07905, partial [Stellaceae bacterium]